MAFITFKRFLFTCTILASVVSAKAQLVTTSTIASNGWAKNSVNAVIFRKNSLVTYKSTQYAAYYDDQGYVVLAQRIIGGTNWKAVRTPYHDDVADAHKSISIMVDGAGYLHVAWGEHNNPLNYARATVPGSLVLGPKMAMTGKKENELSYPEFYKLADGNLLFFYRDGGSGNGNLVINHYDYTKKQWTRLQENLLNGEGQRSAYWQVAIDAMGTIHLSWVWRETPDVASNHDMAYACSKDGGKTWQKSTGKKYKLPIMASSAEYACKIPQNSELINQTSMFADAQGHPFIAIYYKGQRQKGPQYHIIYNTTGKWQTAAFHFRRQPFKLAGMGTKSIPISRPQIVAWNNGSKTAVALIFRDEERGSKISAAISNDITRNQWKITTLLNQSVGSWEPTFDTELWKQAGLLDLFVQKVTQVDAEGNSNAKPEPVQVLEWRPIPVTYQTDKSLIQTANKDFADGAKQYQLLMKKLPADRFPKTFYTGKKGLETSGSDWWCSGFYPGTLLYMYQQTKNPALLHEANRMLDLLAKEQYNTSTHDLGFMMYCSFGNALQIAPKPEYRQILINSAKSLASRFNSKVGAIKSWDSKKLDYLVIIDNMMNLELLFWATKATGDSSFYKIAVTHANTTMKHHFRRNYSSYHVVNYNPETGAVQQRRTAQGYADESAWARGQVWGLYGYTVMYRETHDNKYLDMANHIAAFILNNPNLPADKIPYWDFNAPNIPHALRDASAGAIMASALFELCRYTGDKALGQKYFNIAQTILKTLSAPPYKAPLGTNGGFILQHSVGNMPQHSEVDVPLTYADYYFMQALIRYKNFSK